ncbi:hypothetical protein [Sinorhizobium meliloti]|nr:hypothetical protein [Sinorhizobium meliloti]
MRGVALLAGEHFDSETIRDAVDELDAIDAAEAAEARQERERLLSDDEKRRQNIRKRLASVQKTRDSAIQRAEDAAHALAAALDSVLATSREASTLMMKMGFPPALFLTDVNVKLAASYRLASILYPVCGRKFGRIELPEVGGNHMPDGTNRADSWKEADRKKTGAAFNTALGTGDE